MIRGLFVAFVAGILPAMMGFFFYNSWQFWAMMLAINGAFYLGRTCQS